MPGIFVNDGGSTSSALGNALGGIAADFSPQAYAAAQLVRQQTEEAMWQNRQLSSQVPAQENAAGSAPGLLTTFGANAAPPGATAGDGSVAGTLAGAAVPPISGATGPQARGVLNTSGMTPWQQYVANEIVHGRMSPEALTTSVNLGQSAVSGPGSTYAVQGDVAKARQTPITITSGQTRIQNPEAAAAGGGGGVIQGPSSYTSTGEQAGAGADDALAAKDLETGANAKADLGRADLIDQLYSRVDALGANNPAAIATDEGVRALSDHLGIDLTRFSDVTAMKQEIRSLAIGLTGTLRTTQGDPLPRGSLASIEALSPDPNAPAPQFHSMMQVIKGIAQRQAANFDAAVQFRTDRPKLGDQAGINYHVQRGKNASSEASATRGIDLGSAGGGGGRAPTPQEIDEFNTRVKNGEDPRVLIRNARGAGVDMLGGQ